MLFLLDDHEGSRGHILLCALCMSTADVPTKAMWAAVDEDGHLDELKIFKAYSPCDCK